MLLNLCIVIPAITGIIRFSKINQIFHPFIYFIGLGTLNEIGSYLIIFNGFSNVIISNIYVLLESCLILWQFRNWKLFKKRRVFFGLVLVTFAVAWLLENFIFSHITIFCSHFRIFYSFCIVMCSIIVINSLITTERRNLLKNSTFLICIGYAFYYTLQILVEAFWIYGLGDQGFSTNVYYISIIANFITNLVYTVAIIWIPSKLRFTLPSS